MLSTLDIYNHVEIRLNDKVLSRHDTKDGSRCSPQSSQDGSAGDLSRCSSDDLYYRDMLDFQELERSLKNIPSPKLIRHSHVNLPKRYQRTHGLRLNAEPRTEREGTAKGTEEDRERDIDTAFKWLRQEIMLMKRQDHMLMKQLLELRSSIASIRGNIQHYSFSSCSDIASFDGSCTSLDDSRLNGSLSPLYESEAMEFRGRTMSMLTPRRSAILYLKPKSKETH